ncbi:hypothetical protein FUAX_49980 (plasmid) [Fulvitalea axinellae]|uniref:Uncharacterized protein n=1 Tax=Fulvitalea axinellae TaxID=1182444 RepID=A0AAU9DHI7_9BACT|nr:hypothetical protein FUAX_49980 [Fulvitalea axinellae]
MFGQIDNIKRNEGKRRINVKKLTFYLTLDK